MSLLRKLLKESQFSKSYRIPYNKIPYLLDALPDDINHVEDNNVIYGYHDGSDEAIFKYDINNNIMNSDYTYTELLNLSDD